MALRNNTKQAVKLLVQNNIIKGDSKTEAKKITKYDERFEIQIGDFRVKNSYGVDAYYNGPGGDVVIPENDILETAHIRFDDSKAITSLEISGSVNTLYASDFSSLRNSSKDSLKKIVINEGVKEISGDYFLSGFPNLSEVSLPESLQYLGKDAFLNTPWRENNIQKENGCCYLGNFLIGSDKKIEEGMIRDGTVMICAGAFKKRQSLHTVTIPSSVKVIGRTAFNDCQELEQVFIPESVMDIGVFAFTRCPALKTVEVLAENASVDEFAFADKKCHIPQRAFYPKRYFDKRSTGPIKDYYALCYLTSADRYTEEECTDYNKYIKKRRPYILPVILTEGRMDLLKKSADLILDAKKIDNTIEIAQKSGDTELTSFFLDWKDKHVKKKPVNESAEFDIDKPVRVSDLKMIWNTKKLPDGTLGITGYKGKETVIEVPAAIGKNPVTAICREAFMADTYSPIGKKITEEQVSVRKKITSVTIPEGITSIDYNAFGRCQSLAELHLPKSLKDMNYAHITDKVKIYAPKGSYAIKYAKSNKIDYEEE